MINTLNKYFHDTCTTAMERSCLPDRRPSLTSQNHCSFVYEQALKSQMSFLHWYWHLLYDVLWCVRMIPSSHQTIWFIFRRRKCKIYRSSEDNIFWLGTEANINSKLFPRFGLGMMLVIPGHKCILCLLIFSQVFQKNLDFFCILFRNAERAYHSLG